MAKFNPDQNPMESDWTSASKGVKANTAFGDLFGAAGQIGVAAVSIADQNNLQNIQKQVNEGIDQLNNEWGTQASAFETQITQGNVQPLPADLERYGKHLGDVRKAYLNGTLKESNYQARIDSMSRQIRARYPGYRSEIDSIISKTLGQSTANDLRRALIQEWNAEADKASDIEKENRAFIKQAAFDGSLPADYYKREAEGNPYPMEAVKAHVAAVNKHRADIIQQKNLYELQDKVSDAGKKKLEGIAQRDISDTSQKVFEGAFSIGGMNMQQLKTKVEQGLTKPWTPEETAELTAAFSQMHGTLETQLWSKLNDPFYSGLSPDQKKKLVEQGMSQMNVIKEQILNQQYGLLNFSKQMMDTGAQDTLRRWGLADPLIGQLQAIQSLTGGNAALNSLILNNPEMASKVNQTVLSILSGKLLDPKSGSMQKIINDANAKEGGNLAPEVIKQTLKNATKLILDKDVTFEVAQKAAYTLFSAENQGFLGDFKQSNRMRLFESLISPRMTERIQELAKDDPQIAENYRNWALNSGIALFKQDISTIKDVNLYGNTAMFRWDAAKNKFVEEANVQGQQRSVNAIDQQYDKWAVESAREAVGRLNKYAGLMKPILEAEGSTSQEALTALFEKMGVNKPENVGSLFFRLYETLGKAPEEGKAVGVGKGASREAIEKVLRDQDTELQGYDLDATGSGAMKYDTPRGIRNNNPGNIIFSDFAKARGAKSDGEFAVFDTPQQGINAMYDLLESYQKKGLDTVEDMINRWSPREGDNAENYAKHVAKAMGIEIDTPFLFQGELAQKMIDAMIEFENGGNPYKSGQKTSANE